MIRRQTPGDRFLLASDGLWDNLSLDEIVQTVRKGQLTDAGQALADAASGRMARPREGKPSKPDDLTLVAWRSGG